MEALERAKRKFMELTPKLHADKRFVVTFLVFDEGDHVLYPSVSLVTDTNAWGSTKSVDVLKRENGRYQLVFVGGIIIFLGENNVPCRCLPQMVSEAELDATIVGVLEQWMNTVSIMDKLAEDATAMYGETILPI